MAYTPTPVDTSTPPIPLSSAIPFGTNGPIPIEGGPTNANGGNPVVPVSLYIKDGNDVTLGTSTDANTIASVMGRLTKIRDLLAATLTVGGTITETNSAAILALLDTGQENMANSLSVAIASDQSVVPISHTTVTVLTLASGARATYSSGAIAVGQYVELAFDVNVTALTGGTSPTVKFRLWRIGADGVLYSLYNPGAISAAGSFSTSVGSGFGNTAASFGNSIQIDMVVTGAPTSITFSLSLIGK